MMWVLVASILSISPSKMTEFNYGRFISQVKNRTAGETWIVLFYKDNHDPSKDLLNKLTKTAALSDKTLRFGVVNVEKQVQLADDCGVLVRQCPKIIIYHSNGKTEYVGSKKPDVMYKRFLAFLPNLAENATESWIEEHRSDIAAVLFTKNTTIPPLWRAIAGKFNNTRISIGYCNNEELMDLYDIGELPSIVFYNKTYSVTYEGKNKFKNIIKAITQFSRNEYFPTPTEDDTNYFFSDEFEKECLGGRTLCVAHSVDDLDPKLETVRNEHRGVKAKWFYGSDFPLGFIKAKEVWVINPRKKTARGVRFDEVHDALKGNGEWTPIDALSISELL